MPVVLTRDEVRAVLAELHGTAWLVVAILYGGGLRLWSVALVDTSDFGQVLDEA